MSEYAHSQRTIIVTAMAAVLGLAAGTVCGLARSPVAALVAGACAALVAGLAQLQPVDSLLDVPSPSFDDANSKRQRQEKPEELYYMQSVTLVTISNQNETSRLTMPEAFKSPPERNHYSPTATCAACGNSWIISPGGRCGLCHSLLSPKTSTVLLPDGLMKEGY
jgi:hypothetical protein